MPLSAHQPQPKKNGLWAVLLATSFFAIIFWLVWFVGKVVEKLSDAYTARQVRRRRAAKERAQAAAAPAGGVRPPRAAGADEPAKAAADKKDE
ncbi:hypothetical protein KFE25_012228 [Diacronema lutheri]|uniref:Uncharacterized protein n=1 Tax=Diacronema lutheri TaxID=2081491 RepID=A0A8J5X9L7_DIALT|nr:hypothetical protein KFE25_012228 [Diacronema lutheri]